MSTSPSVQPASRPVSSSLVASRANTAEQGSKLFREAAKLGNPLGGDQIANAEGTGNGIIEDSEKLGKIKRNVAAAQGMQELFSKWVDRLWM